MGIMRDDFGHFDLLSNFNWYDFSVNFDFYHSDDTEEIVTKAEEIEIAKWSGK